MNKRAHKASSNAARTRALERQFRDIVENLPELAWSADASGHIDFYNQRWYRYTGTTFAEMEGWGWKTVQHPDWIDVVLHRWTQSLQSGASFEMEFPLRRADGEYRWFLTRVQALRSPTGKIVRWFGTNTDIHDQRQVRLALEASEARYRTLLDNPEQLVWTNSARGEMRGEQLGWARFTGQEFAEYQSHGWIDAIHPDDRAETLMRWEHAVATLEIFKVEHRVRRHDGVYRLFSVRAVPVFNTDNSLREWVGMHSDVTKERAADAEKVQLLERERAVMRHRDEFLALASHELRTPVTSALLQLETVQRIAAKNGGVHTLPEARLDKMMRTVTHQMKTLRGLIDDLLDVSRVIHGRLTMNFERADLVEIARRALAQHQELLDAAGCKNTLVTPPKLWVRCDPRRIEQVLSNLLTNACKYAAGKPVLVRLQALDNMARLSVEDHGMGMTRETQDRVFERFERAVEFRSVSGLGLGLYITRDIVTAHGGSIHVESVVSQGSTFVMELPMDLQSV